MGTRQPNTVVVPGAAQSDSCLSRATPPIVEPIPIHEVPAKDVEHVQHQTAPHPKAGGDRVSAIPRVPYTDHRKLPPDEPYMVALKDYSPSRDTWRTFIDQRAHDLEAALMRYKPTSYWTVRCTACEKVMGNSIHAHLKSKDHAKTLQKKLNYNYPPKETAEGFNGPWISRFPCEEPCGAEYWFNNLTGAQGLELVGTEKPEPMRQPAAVADIAHTVPVECGPASHGQANPPVPVSTEQLQPSLHRPLPCSPPEYEEALSDWGNKRGAYRRYMEPIARTLEQQLMQHLPNTCWGLVCPVCKKTMARGCGDHIASRNHACEIQKMIHWNIPPPDVAADWSQPWVMCCPCERPQGATYWFNMLTGAAYVSPPTEIDTIAEPAVSCKGDVLTSESAAFVGQKSI